MLAHDGAGGTEVVTLEELEGDNRGGVEGADDKDEDEEEEAREGDWGLLLLNWLAKV